MSDQVCMDGPFEIDVRVHITDGKNTGIVTIGLASGTIPTAADIKKAVIQAGDAAENSEMRLMNRHEFVTAMMDVGPIAVPGPKDFEH